MLQKHLLLTIILCSFCFTTTASAIPRIKAQDENGIEADEITISLHSDKLTGVAVVKGCSVCPLQLDIDEQTVFFSQHKSISRGELSRYSGKSGAVFFIGKRTTKVHW